MRQLTWLLLGLGMMAATGCRTAGGSDGPARPASPESEARSQQTVHGTWKGAVLSGPFTRGELEAITTIVVRETSHGSPKDGRLLSFERRGDDVVVMTGYVCGTLCGRGYQLVFRNVEGSWTVVDRSMWVS